MFDSLLTSQSLSRAFAIPTPLTTDISSNALAQLGMNSSWLRGAGAIDPTGMLARSMVQMIGNEAKQVVDQFAGRVPFADGQVTLDISTGLGKIQGTIEFGNGALVSNLNTPLGPYFSSIDFKEQDQIKFQVGQMTGVLNLNDGLVIVDLQPQKTGGEIAFPINALKGTVEFKDGQAIVNTDGFGTVAKIDLSALAQKTVTEALTNSETLPSIKGSVTSQLTAPTTAIPRNMDLSALLR